MHARFVRQLKYLHQPRILDASDVAYFYSYNVKLIVQRKKPAEASFPFTTINFCNDPCYLRGATDLLRT